MKKFLVITALTLCGLLTAGCVSTATHQKAIDKAAALASSVTTLQDDKQKLQTQEAACSKALDDSERRRTETQRQLEEKQIALERAQADIVRIEMVLTDRNQEAGKSMTQMRREIDRLFAEVTTLTGQNKQQEEALQKLRSENTRLIQERDHEIKKKE